MKWAEISIILRFSLGLALRLFFMFVLTCSFSGCLILPFGKSKGSFGMAVEGGVGEARYSTESMETFFSASNPDEEYEQVTFTSGRISLYNEREYDTCGIIGFWPRLDWGEIKGFCPDYTFDLFVKYQKSDPTKHQDRVEFQHLLGGFAVRLHFLWIFDIPLEYYLGPSTISYHDINDETVTYDLQEQGYAAGLGLKIPIGDRLTFKMDNMEGNGKSHYVNSENRVIRLSYRYSLAGFKYNF